MFSMLTYKITATCIECAMVLWANVCMGVKQLRRSLLFMIAMSGSSLDGKACFEA